MGKSILMKSNIGKPGAELSRCINRIQSHNFNGGIAWRPTCFSGRILVRAFLNVYHSEKKLGINVVRRNEADISMSSNFLRKSCDFRHN
jgi:hypothetical protein